ncbi:MAG: glycerate kinase [Blastococcus sp.]
MLTGKVVVCLDKFRGSLSAVDACAAVADGVRSVLPAHEVVTLPVADGGEGTVAAVVGAGARAVSGRVTGPAGRPVTATFAVHGDRAVIELAEAAGLHLLGNHLQPLTATTRGVGELIRAALDLGCRTVVLAVGGSATTDGGAGMLQALGARLLDRRGVPVAPGGGALRDLAVLDLTGLDPRLGSCEVLLASDVDNPLLGPDGAAAVFGPQKGASDGDVAILEEGLARWARAVAGETGRDLSAEPGAGAAGGTGFAALTVLGAHRRPGIDVVLDEIGADRQLAGAALVVVGEGRLDEQSLHGKAPVGVARRTPPGVPVVAVCGQCTVGSDRLREVGISGVETVLEAAGGDVARAMTEAGVLLEGIGRTLAARYLSDGVDRVPPDAGPSASC